MMKNQKGITLIALVITIIVLLILAGVSIAMLTGDNGLLNRAEDSKYATIEGQLRDEIGLAVSELRIDQVDNTIKVEDSAITCDNIVDKIIANKNFDLDYTTVESAKASFSTTEATEDADGTIKLTLDGMTYTATIDTNGKIQSITHKK